MTTPAEQEADRLDQLLDLVLAALKADDMHAAVMALEEAVKTAQKLPQKAPT